MGPCMEMGLGKFEILTASGQFGEELGDAHFCEVAGEVGDFGCFFHHLSWDGFWRGDGEVGVVGGDAEILF